MLHDLNSQRAVYAIQNKTLDERLVILICDRVCHDEREGKTYNCPAYGQNSFENAIRSLQNENVEFVLFDNLLTTEINVILDIRLPDIYRKTCPILLLCHKGKYKEIPLILSPKIVRKFVEHAMANYYEIENEWSKIKAPLTEIQLQYLVDEYNIVKIQWNRNLMIAGFIGGIATLVLGISIFWGLDGT
uniref:Caspase family protein n=1 Tax=Rhabditophanes sp. KR3021 TaxID=114890 RepID=A0AC35U1Y7_9BILA